MAIATLIRAAAAEIAETSLPRSKTTCSAPSATARRFGRLQDVMREKAQGAREGLTEVRRAREKAVAA